MHLVKTLHFFFQKGLLRLVLKKNEGNGSLRESRALQICLYYYIPENKLRIFQKIVRCFHEADKLDAFKVHLRLFNLDRLMQLTEGRFGVQLLCVRDHAFTQETLWLRICSCFRLAAQLGDALHGGHLRPDARVRLEVLFGLRLELLDELGHRVRFL